MNLQGSINQVVQQVGLISSIAKSNKEAQISNIRQAIHDYKAYSQDMNKAKELQAAAKGTLEKSREKLGKIDESSDKFYNKWSDEAIAKNKGAQLYEAKLMKGLKNVRGLVTAGNKQVAMMNEAYDVARVGKDLAEKSLTRAKININDIGGKK